MVRNDTPSNRPKPGRYPRKLREFGGALELIDRFNLFIALNKQKYFPPQTSTFPPYYPDLLFTFLLIARIIAVMDLIKYPHYLTPLYVITIYYYGDT